MHKNPDHPIISTLEDLHGEKREKEELESLLSSFPSRIPINIEHDLSRSTTGYVDNFRIVPIAGTEGEWMLIGDHYTESPVDLTMWGGLSLSFLKPISSNTQEDSEFAIYLPYPHYRDAELIARLHQVDVPLTVGGWHKKGLDSEQVGLILGLIMFVVGPEWTRFYDNVIRPRLAQLMGSIAENEGLSYHYQQRILCENGRHLNVSGPSGPG